MLVKLVVVHCVGGVNDAAEADETVLSSEALLGHAKEEVEVSHLVGAASIQGGSVMYLVSFDIGAVAIGDLARHFRILEG